MSVSTVDESVDLKISASACERDQWRVYAQKSMVAQKAWLSAKEKIHGTTVGPSQKARIVEGWRSIRNFSLFQLRGGRCSAINPS